MQNGQKTGMRARQPRPAGTGGNRPKRWSSGAPRQESKNSQSAQRNYERYIALAQAEVLAGDVVSAENYYQHAEHYFRSMSPDRDAT